MNEDLRFVRRTLIPKTMRLLQRLHGEVDCDLCIRWIWDRSPEGLLLVHYCLSRASEPLVGVFTYVSKFGFLGWGEKDYVLMHRFKKISVPDHLDLFARLNLPNDILNEQPKRTSDYLSSGVGPWIFLRIRGLEKPFGKLDTSEGVVGEFQVQFRETVDRSLAVVSNPVGHD